MKTSLKLRPKLKKKMQKVQIFGVLMQISSNFDTLANLEMKTFNKERICCPRGFFEEINAICFEKMPQIQSEIDKHSKKFKFLKFPCTFCLIFRIT